MTGVTCAATTLAPTGQLGDSATCTGTYQVTRADAERGTVINVAVAAAEDGTVRAHQDQARITIDKKPCHNKHCKPKPCHDKHHKHDKHCKVKPRPCHQKNACRPM